MGKSNFQPPTESTPLDRSPKIVTGDYVGDFYMLQLCQIRCKSIHGGLLGIRLRDKYLTLKVGPRPPGSNHRRLKLVSLNFQYKVSLASFIVTRNMMHRLGTDHLRYSTNQPPTNQLMKPLQYTCMSLSQLPHSL